jgi:phage replication O-like protein O
MASDWNQLMELLAKVQLSPTESRVMAALARKTLGFKKPNGDRIAASQLAKLTGLGRTHVTEALIRLEQRGLIRRDQLRPGKAAWIALCLHSAPVQELGHPDLSGFSDTHLSDPGGQEPVRVLGHTKVEGVKTSEPEPPKPTLQRQAFDAYIGASGTLLLDRERGALARSVTAALNAGTDQTLILAAVRDLGRTHDFPGLLKSRIKELRDNGGPCEWAGLDRSALTRTQLDQCACTGCGEWAEARAENASSPADGLFTDALETPRVGGGSS